MSTGGARSAVYIFISSITSKVILILGGVFLARILPVEDFGYLLTLNIIFGFISLFSISGFEFYFIQNREHVGRDEMILLRQVFNLRLLQSVLLFVVTNIIALLQYLYYDPTLGILLSISSFLFLIGLISKPEETVLTKRLDYGILSKSGVLRDILASLSKIGFALSGFGPISFSAGNTIGALGYSLFIKKKTNLNLLKTIGTRETIEPYRRVRKFGFHLFLNTAGSFLTRQVDKIFVASFFEKDDQGYYQFAGNYAAYPFNTLIAPQNNMVLSLMSKNKSKAGYLVKLFDTYGAVSSLVLLPLFLFIYIYSQEIIGLLVGIKWYGAVPLFRIFLIYYLIKIIFYPVNGILTSFGRPDIKAKITLGTFLLSIPILLYISYLEVEIYYYAFVFVLISSLSDLICSKLGLKLVEEPMISFLLKRIKYMHVSILLTLFLVLLSRFNYSNDIVEVIIALGITLLFIYITLVIYSKVFLEFMFLFIKNKNIQKYISSFLIVKN